MAAQNRSVAIPEDLVGMYEIEFTRNFSASDVLQKSELSNDLKTLDDLERTMVEVSAFANSFFTRLSFQAACGLSFTGT